MATPAVKVGSRHGEVLIKNHASVDCDINPSCRRAMSQIYNGFHGSHVVLSRMLSEQIVRKPDLTASAQMLAAIPGTMQGHHKMQSIHTRLLLPLELTTS